MSFRHLFIIAITLLMISCSQKQKTEQSTPAGPVSIPVKATTVIDTTIVQTITVSGELKPAAQVDVFVKTAGLITAKMAKIGQRVQKDEILAEMVQDIPGMQFSPSKIKATSTGIITMDAIEVGSSVTPQRPVFGISQLNPIEMAAKVAETYIGQLKNGASVQVSLSAFPSEIFKGRITEVSPQLEPVSRSITIKIQLSNSQGRLRPGMFGRAQLEIGAHRGCMIPLDAVVQTGVTRSVFRIEQGKARQKIIQTGIISGELVEVMGLKAGDQIVILGQNLLDDGVDIRIVEE